MRLFIYFFLSLSAIFSAYAQWEDNFSPSGASCCNNWVGDTGKYIINHEGRLQLFATGNSGLACISRTAAYIDDATWTFDVFMDFNPSAYNYADVYLVSNKPPGAFNVHGYFVRIGYSTDEISLYRQSGDHSSILKVIDGMDNVTNTDRVRVRIKVARSAAGTWTLMRSLEMDENYVIEGVATDTTCLGNQFFSISCRYTVSRSTQFFFDNIRLTGDPPVDIQPPIVDTLIVVGDRILDLHFSEPLHPDIALHPENFIIDHDIGMPIECFSMTDDHRQIRLVFNEAFIDGTGYMLTCNDISDPFMNFENQTINFNYKKPYQAGYRDVVINEIMADPYPSIGLPDVEYVELYNTTDEWINLEGWSLEGVGGKPFSGYFLGPNEYVLLIKKKMNTGWEDHSIIWGTGGLLNEGEALRLVDPSGQLIDSTIYDLTFYGDVSKKNGGWSLELIDPYHCSSDKTNWGSSVDPSGGTPLRENSVFQAMDDSYPPVLVELRSIDEQTIHLSFNEWISGYGTISVTGVDGTTAVRPDSTGYGLYCQVENPFIHNNLYELKMNGISDCAGNKMEAQSYLYLHDAAGPYAREVISFSDSRLGILFDEKVDIKSALATGNYSLNQGNVHPSNSSIIYDSIVVLDFDVPLTYDRSYWLVYSGIEDLSGNICREDSLSFQPSTNLAPAFNELVITEIMADPDPTVGMPASEYIEVYNVTDRRMAVNDLTLIVGKKLRTIPAMIIDPHQFMLLCPSTRVGLFEIKNKISVADWPAIINRADTLSLYTEEGQQIFNTAFEESWYRDMEKHEGGWSLEIIDPYRPCAGMDNWQASRHPKGGTAGGQNSVYASKPDLSGPKLLHAMTPDSLHLLITFNEKLDPVSVTNATIEIQPAADVQSWHLIQPMLQQMLIYLSKPLLAGTKYTVLVTNISDCSGNMISSGFNAATVFLPEPAESADIVFSEVLYDPRPGGVEFVELVNRSSKYIDIRGWEFALEREGNYYRRKSISGVHQIFQPGAYLALTIDPYVLKGDYPRGRLENFFHFPDMPPLSDDGNIIVLVDNKGQVIDRFQYQPGYHHPWLDDTEGVSLERIDLREDTNDPVNWTSAAKDHAYATPGLPNSQSYQAQPDLLEIEIIPRIIMANQNDAAGTAKITYTSAMPGLMANIEVFDLSGRMIKKIAENANLAGTGSFQWRGRDEYGKIVDMGYYIVRIETFGPLGNTKMIRETVAVGRR